MKKVGILTFHCANNYGAVLQAYALQEYIASIGYEVEIIDYRPEYIVNGYRFFPPLRQLPWFIKIRRILVFLLICVPKLIRLMVFNKFKRGKLKLSKTVYDVSFEQELNYDFYVLGSDQIWNPKITNGFDRIFFGDFHVKAGAKKIAYAPSMGIVAPSIEQRNFLVEKLRKIHSLSSREASLSEFLTVLGFKAKAVVDPTLLFDVGFWEKVAISPKIKGKFVLLYMVRYSKEAERFAKDISLQINAEVIILEPKVRHFPKRNSFQFASPEEFIGLIKCASCIVTTSFHGTVFSTIFQRDFYSLKLEDGNDGRISEFLDMIKLKERHVKPNCSTVFTTVNYLNAKSKFERMRCLAKEYLDEAFRN